MSKVTKWLYGGTTITSKMAKGCVFYEVGEDDVVDWETGHVFSGGMRDCIIGGIHEPVDWDGKTLRGGVRYLYMHPDHDVRTTAWSKAEICEQRLKAERQKKKDRKEILAGLDPVRSVYRRTINPADRRALIAAVIAHITG